MINNFFWHNLSTYFFMYKFSAYIFFYRNLKTNIFFLNSLGPPPGNQMVRPLKLRGVHMFDDPIFFMPQYFECKQADIE